MECCNCDTTTLTQLMYSKKILGMETQEAPYQTAIYYLEIAQIRIKLFPPLSASRSPFLFDIRFVPQAVISGMSQQ